MALKIVGFGLVVVLIGWISHTIAVEGFYRPEPAVLGMGKAFDANERLPQKEIEDAFEFARLKMKEKNDSGNMFKIIGNVTGWISFFVASFITLWAGYKGHPINPEEFSQDEVKEVLKNYSSGLRKVVGILSACVAVMTLASEKASSTSDDYYKSSDELQVLINDSRANLIDAGSEELARDILVELKVKANR